jgi:hypothetical protein
VNRLHKHLINLCRYSPKGVKAKQSKKKFKWEHILFFNNSDGDFHSENNNVSHIQGVSAKTFEPNISVICQRTFMKFKMQIF